MMDVIRQRLREGRWHRSLRQIHPEADVEAVDVSRLRLIIGTPRSGTNWLGETLAASTASLRYFNEPIYKMQPTMPFERAKDHTVIAYQPLLEPDHPLVKKYRLLAADGFSRASVEGRRCLLRDDAEWEVSIVKEVHSLLATEGLLAVLPCPTLLVVRDPVRVCDSLFSRDGLSSQYAVGETELIFDEAYLQRFVDDQREQMLEEHAAILQHPGARQRCVQERVLVIALLQASLRVLAAAHGHTRLVEYEQQCTEPETVFAEAAAFFGLPWDKKEQDFLRTTLSARGEGDDPHAIFRDTSAQLDRPFKFLTPPEVEAAYQLLERVGLTSL